MKLKVTNNWENPVIQRIALIKIDYRGHTFKSRLDELKGIKILEYEK